jgi:hypothetical protein
VTIGEMVAQRWWSMREADCALVRSCTLRRGLGLRRNPGRWKRETWCTKGGGSAAAQRQRTMAPVKEGWCRRLGELHRDHRELLDTPMVEQ